MELVVARHLTDGVSVLGLSGSLDIDTAPKLRTTMEGLLAAPVPRIIVDLSGLTFCDSIGLSAFVVAHRQCTAAMGYLRLAAPRPFMLRMLAVVGVTPALPVFHTVDGARTGDPEGRLLFAPEPGFTDR